MEQVRARISHYDQNLFYRFNRHRGIKIVILSSYYSSWGSKILQLEQYC